MYISKGALVVGEWRGAPVRFHWSVALGVLVFGGLRWRPGFWLGFCLLVLIHELGHAFLVHRFGLKIHDVVVHGFGGYCEWSGSATPMERAIIAWGGIWAQMLILPLAFLLLYFDGTPYSVFKAEMFQVFTRYNIWLILLNMIPVRPLDGAEAWSLFGIKWREYKLARLSGGSVLGSFLGLFRASWRGGKTRRDITRRTSEINGPGDAWMNELMGPLRKEGKNREPPE